MKANKLSYVTSILVFLTLTSSLYLNLKPVSAQIGVPPNDPSNVWAPYGPIVKNIRIQYYSDPIAELNDFIGGHLDLVDSPTLPAAYSSGDSNPDFLQSPPQGTFQYFGIHFNGDSSRFTASQETPISPAHGPAWGCDWNTGTSFTSNRQTYVTNCGIQMRQGFAHLIDRPRFASSLLASRITAVPLVDPSPPAVDPSGSSLQTQCSWDTLYPSILYPSCLGAYHFGDNPSGFAAPGSLDFCAAADHMMAAGVATGKQNSTCVLTGVNLGVFAAPLRMMYSPSRRVLATGFVNALNQLFGGQAAGLCRGGNCICPPEIPCVPPFPIDSWDAEAYGYGIIPPYPTHLYYLYYSQFAGNYCGGRASDLFPTQWVCIPELDQHLKVLGQTIDLNTFRSETLASFNILGANAVEIPTYSRSIRTLALRAETGLVNAKGFGYNNFNTILNIHKDNSYTPVNQVYTFGGGDSSTLRYGQGSGTNYLNIFNAQTVSDFQTLSNIYDTLFTASPVQLGNVFCWMCDSYTQSVDSKGNEHFLVQLRQNLRWHDGGIVDAKDVAFSLLALRDLAPTAGGALTGVLLGTNVLSNTTLDIVFNGTSISYPVSLETMIIPRHLWQCDLVPENDCAAGNAAVTNAGGNPSDYTNAGVNVPSAARIDPSFDPLTFHILIGSGPFMCRSQFPSDLGMIGTGCALNADGSRSGQIIGPGGAVLLQAFDRTNEPGNSDPFLQYMRSYNPSWGTGTGTATESGQFQEFNWADHNKEAQVTLSDLGSVAACFGASGPTSACPWTVYNYWLRPAFHPNTPTTISSEVAIVASHLDDTYVSSFSWNPPNLENIVPYPT